MENFVQDLRHDESFIGRTRTQTKEREFIFLG